MPNPRSQFFEHIDGVLAHLTPDTKSIARALIRERADEDRHLAKQIRATGRHVPALVNAADQIEARAKLLDEQAEKWKPAHVRTPLRQGGPE